MYILPPTQSLYFRRCSAHPRSQLMCRLLPWQAWEANTFWIVSGNVPWMPPVVWISYIINRREMR